MRQLGALASIVGTVMLRIFKMPIWSIIDMERIKNTLPLTLLKVENPSVTDFLSSAHNCSFTMMLLSGESSNVIDIFDTSIH
jgi:hypothetical protein